MNEKLFESKAMIRSTRIDEIPPIPYSPELFVDISKVYFPKPQDKL